MERSRWQQIDMLLKSALERPPDERGAFLDAACAGDPQARREVESLLRHDGGEGLLGDPAADEAMRLLADDGWGGLAGREVGHYEILERLGRGGMGVVYRARDKRLGRTVALKLLPQRFTQDRERLRRFEREARAASSLNHPNILTIFDIGTDGPVPFIATEYIDGETLRQRMARGVVPPATGEKQQLTNTPAHETRPCATADGRSVLYVETKAGVSNVWGRALDGSPPKRLTDFKSEEFFDFDVSRGGDFVFSRGVVLSDAVIIKHLN
jgi:hypothetical protein